MINKDKPSNSTPVYLNVGSGFTFLVGGGYRLLINSISGAFVNKDKASIGETWATISTTYATETRTWLAVSQLFTNATIGLTEPLWAYRTFPWTMPLPWQDTDTGMKNESKPS